MKYTEQDLKDEYEQAIKRKGKLYAEGYVEGLKDAQTQALTIPVVVERSLSEKIDNLLDEIRTLDDKGEWYGFMHDPKNSTQITRLWNFCR